MTWRLAVALLFTVATVVIGGSLCRMTLTFTDGSAEVRLRRGIKFLRMVGIWEILVGTVLVTLGGAWFQTVALFGTGIVIGIGLPVILKADR